MKSKTKPKRPPSLTDLREDVTYYLGRKRGAIALHNAMAATPGMTRALFEASYRHCEAVTAEYDAAYQALKARHDKDQAKHAALDAVLRAEREAREARQAQALAAVAESRDPACTACGASTADLEGYGGLCGDCADGVVARCARCNVEIYHLHDADADAPWCEPCEQAAADADTQP